MTPPTAASPWTVTLAWTPNQNLGAVSVLNGRAPVFAILGLLQAGETPEIVADEFGITLEQIEVLRRLADEARGWFR